jgi:lysophospholipase L1-like esterase
MEIVRKYFYSCMVVYFFILSSNRTSAQPYIREISHFNKMDSLNRPPENPILFIGSSSFTNWKDVQDWFPDYTILNRAFGGSSLTHLIYYAENVIFRYNPRQILIYCGENDLATDPKITGDSVYRRFRKLIGIIRTRLPKVPVAYVSMKPSPSREKFLPYMKTGNRMIEKYMNRTKFTEYIDVYNAMLEKDGTVMKDIFLSDKLHMNRKGYEIWKPIIGSYLIK